MGNIQFKDLPSAAPTVNDLFPFSQNGNARKASLAQIRGVVNDLTTGGIDVPLSAEQGKLLNSSLSDRVKKTTADITYYVNASTGSDTTGDGLTSGTAFKTIQYAINKVPLFLNNAVNIILASGTYNEDIVIANLKGSIISITGGGAINTTYNVKSITVKNCDAINIVGINITSTVGIAIQLDRVRYCYLNYINSIASFSGDNILISSGSMVYINNSVFSNHTYSIRAGFSTVLSNSNSGSNNVYGLVSQDGSTIVKNGTQPTGTTSEVSQIGGLIR